jgi:hypothetical protein
MKKGAMANVRFRHFLGLSDFCEILNSVDFLGLHFAFFILGFAFFIAPSDAVAVGSGLNENFARSPSPL